MGKEPQDKTRGDKREVMKGPRGRGQDTGGDREIMKGAHGRGQTTAGEREIMAPGNKKSKKRK